MQWRAIEEIEPDSPIWVIQYTLYTNDLGEFCDKDHHEAEPMTDIHGWYESEADAYKVLNHFRKPNTYKVRKAHKRRLI